MYLYQGSLILRAPEKPDFIWERYALANNAAEAQKNFGDFFFSKLTSHPFAWDLVRGEKVFAYLAVQELSQTEVVEYEP